MFRTSAEARQQLTKALTDPEALEAPLAAAEIEQILSRLAPQFWIAPSNGLIERAGGTRFGGAPDLPGDMAWPMRSVPKPYVYPSRAMRLQRILHLPSCGAREMLDDPALAERLEDFDFRICYDELLRGEYGMKERLDICRRRHRVRGTPEPEQDDPRAGLELNEPADWQLLLQLDLADLAQQPLAEGTVYFLIPRASLAARRFSDVRAVSGQT